MTSMQLWLAIVGTGFTIAGGMSAGGLFILRLVISEKIATPIASLTESIASLHHANTELSSKFGTYRDTKEAERTENREIIADLSGMIKRHDERLGNHDTRIALLEQPDRVAAIRGKRRTT